MKENQVILTLGSDSMERLRRLQERTGAASMADMFEKALRTYESLANHLEQGSTFTMQQRNGEVIGIDFLIEIPQTKPHLTLVRTDSDD